MARERAAPRSSSPPASLWSTRVHGVVDAEQDDHLTVWLMIALPPTVSFARLIMSLKGSRHTFSDVKALLIVPRPAYLRP